MARSQPFYASCNGGLALHLSKFDLLDNPGVALRLRNFEVSLKGGYRRINGYLALGGDDATRPATETPVYGVYPYALGAVAVVDDGIYYSEDGITWLQINKDASTGEVEAALISASELVRPNQGQAQFVLAKGTDGYADNPYGVLYIATGADKLAHFHIDGVGGGRTFHYFEISTPSSAKWIAEVDQHLCVVEDVDVADPNNIHYSNTADYDGFSGTGSGTIAVTKDIEGIKAFRNTLYVFSESGISKILNLNDPDNIAAVDVTDKLGCISGYSIQEIGGDLVFLSLDGLRSVAATERIDDVELGNVAPGISSLITPFASNINSYNVSSVVIASKNQYRLFFINSNSVGQGFCGTLVTNTDGSRGYQWSELRDLDVRSISSGPGATGDEVTYHGDDFGNIFIHDVGDSFNGSKIRAEWKAPDTHLGDFGMRKTLNYIKPSITKEGIISIRLSASFEDNNPNILAPAPILIANSEGVYQFGSAVFGQALFGVASQTLDRVNLQGSGNTVSFTFYSDDTNAPYIINGYHLEFTPSGRR